MSVCVCVCECGGMCVCVVVCVCACGGIYVCVVLVFYRVKLKSYDKNLVYMYVFGNCISVVYCALS